jgi:hypothetical protein
MNEVTTPGSLNEPHTRDTLLEQLNFLIDGARSNLMDMKASLAIDGPLLKPETLYTKEQVIDMVKQAYNLGATAHEENMTVDSGSSWSEGVEVEVEVEEGGFRYQGNVEVDTDIIKEAVTFKDHNITDEQVEEIINA